MSFFWNKLSLAGLSRLKLTWNGKIMVRKTRCTTWATNRNKNIQWEREKYGEKLRKPRWTVETSAQLRMCKYAIVRNRFIASPAIRSAHCRPKRTTRWDASFRCVARPMKYKRGLRDTGPTAMQPEKCQGQWREPTITSVQSPCIFCFKIENRWVTGGKAPHFNTF